MQRKGYRLAWKSVRRNFPIRYRAICQASILGGRRGNLSSTSGAYEGIPRAGRGPYWQDLQVGAKIKTFSRTVTEADLVNFISCTGMLEHTFIDATHRGVMSGRAVAAALTFRFIECLLFQTLI